MHARNQKKDYCVHIKNRIHKSKTRQNSSMDKGIGRKARNLAKEQFPIDNSWERENQFHPVD